MKAKEIRDLIDFISNSDLDEVNIETQEFKIAVKKNSPVVNTVVETPAPVASVTPQVVAETPKPQVAAPVETAASTPVENSNYVEIKSPMIGTFYDSANPESDAFIKVGDSVKVGQTVCIVEAMKLFQ